LKIEIGEKIHPRPQHYHRRKKSAKNSTPGLNTATGAAGAFQFDLKPIGIKPVVLADGMLEFKLD
jgi:hypothetical protein